MGYYGLMRVLLYEGPEVPPHLQLVYSRARDKEDKSLEVYKFFTNALYVAVTRAVEEVVWLEEDPQHPFLRLLGLEPGKELALAARASSREEWAREAARLEAHGNLEQAKAVREAFLKERPVPWSVYDRERVRTLLPELRAGRLGKKVLKELYEYALFHRARPLLQALAQAGHEGAGNVLRPLLAPTPDYARDQLDQLERRLLRTYEGRGWKEVLWEVKDYGPNFRNPLGLTPLMLAARAGNRDLLEALLAQGADPEARDPFGYTPFLHALERALEDRAFAREGFPLVADLLSPTALDLQVEGHLVRLYPRMAEYWVFLGLLARLKALALPLPYLWRPGTTAAHLAEGLGHLPRPPPGHPGPEGDPEGAQGLPGSGPGQGRGGKRLPPRPQALPEGAPGALPAEPPPPPAPGGGEGGLGPPGRGLPLGGAGPHPGGGPLAPSGGLKRELGEP